MVAVAAVVVTGCGDGFEKNQAWKAGKMVIHHLSTGRGNCTYIVMPDGTTMMIDCGDDPVSGAIEHNEMQPKMPNEHCTTAQNIVNYVKSVAPAGKEARLDCFFLTHFHIDHCSAFDGIAEQMEIGKIVDRAYPDYPDPENCEDLSNYQPAVERLVAEGKSVAEKFRVGALGQFGTCGETVPAVEIRNLCGAGYCWTGEEENNRKIYDADPDDENMNSCGIKISWGDFSYMTCGDIPGGYLAPDDMQTAVAGVCGDCDVVVACHHGYQDSMLEELCRAADAKAYVIPTREYWHPSGLSVENMCNPEFHTADPMLYCTGLLESQKENFKELGYADKFTPAGHIVVRVGDNGKWFRIYVLDSKDENHPVIYKTKKIR